MFINVSEKKSSPKFLQACAKNFNMTISELSAYEKLYKTKERGIYAAYMIDAYLILNPLRYEVVSSGHFMDLAFRFPKSIIKREKRKLSKLGFTHLRDSLLHLNYYKECINKNNKISDSEKSSLLKDISRYSVMKNYGIADNEFQIKKRFKFLEKSENKYIIIMEPVWRSQQPESGGFRYHKHGPYIGCQDLKSEYLYDDKNVEKVFLFHVYQIKEKKSPNFEIYNHQISNNIIFNKKEEAVATINKKDREIIIGYMNSDQKISIPDIIDITNETEILKFIENQEILK